MLAKPNDSFDLTINEYHYTLEKLLGEHRFEEAVQVLKDDICDISAYFKGE